jgi:hypothetical protein
VGEDRTLTGALNCRGPQATSDVLLVRIVSVKLEKIPCFCGAHLHVDQ